MPQRLNILIAGGYDPDDAAALDAPVEDVRAFGEALGRQTIEQGHNLLTGCQTELDQLVAEAAASHSALSDASECKNRIVSYILDGKAPAHQTGTIIKSSRADWDIGGRDPSPPEVVQNANAVILLGGFYGTFKAANWARLARIPLLPFRSFGGASRDVYEEERKHFHELYDDLIQPLDFERVLASASKDWDQLAKESVQLAEKLASERSVLVCMSFEESWELGALLTAVKEVCKEFDYDSDRIDEVNFFKRIVPEILKKMRRSAFVVVDVTQEKPNVYYELGFADGLTKDIILTAKEGTELPFNVKDLPVIYWKNLNQFKDDLRKRVRELASYQGRAEAGA